MVWVVVSERMCQVWKASGCDCCFRSLVSLCDVQRSVCVVAVTIDSNLMCPSERASLVVVDKGFGAVVCRDLSGALCWVRVEVYACNGIMSKAESKELSQVVVVDKSVGCWWKSTLMWRSCWSMMWCSCPDGMSPHKSQYRNMWSTDRYLIHRLSQFLTQQESLAQWWCHIRIVNPE
jgi:hypothetical protein